MNNVIDRVRLIKYWFVFFLAHLAFLLFAVWNVYFVRHFTPDPLKVVVTNEPIFNGSLLAGLLLFVVSIFFGKTFHGLMWSLGFSLLISMLGLFVLFAIDSFYFLLWFIIGLLGTGIHLFRFQNALEKT